MTTDHRAYLLDIAGRALRGEIADINVRADGSLRLLNAGKELMWTGYSPEAEWLKGLIVQVDANERPIALVAGAIGKFYNATESATNDAAFFAVFDAPGARTYFLEKADGSCLRSYVHPDSGEVQWATRGMLQAGMHASPFGDFSAMARRVAQERYPALLDPRLVGRYTIVCELITPDNHIVRDYAGLRDMPVIAVIDLHTGREMTRRQVVELCAAHGLSPIPALRPLARDFDGAIAELRATWAGTDLEGTVVTVEHPDRAVPFRLKVKGQRYLELMRLQNNCSLRRTREIAEAQDIGDLDSFVGYLRRESPDLPEEIRMIYERHFVRYAEWEKDNRAERERLVGLFVAHPLVGSSDRRAFALSIADLTEKWALFKLRDQGPEGAAAWLLDKIRIKREKILGATEEAGLTDAGAA